MAFSRGKKEDALIAQCKWCDRAIYAFQERRWLSRPDFVPPILGLVHETCAEEICESEFGRTWH